MGTLKHDMNGSSSQLINVCEAEIIDEKSVLKEILSEMKKTRDVLEQVQENTKDSIKEMKWYKRREDNVAVYIRMSFVMVGDIDTVKQEFQCEFYMTVRWNEPELIGKTTDDIIDWEKCWDPSIYIVDIVSYDIYEKTQKLVPSQLSNEPPDVVQYFHIKGTFKEILEVNKFPFDYQDLTLVLTSNWEVSEVTLQKDPNRDDNIRTWNFTARQEWDLQQHVLTESTQNQPEEGSSPNIFPLYKVRLHVRRQFGFYLYNIALIMCLITALTFTSFAVGADSIGDRIQITLTLLLTSVAFKYYVQQFVPTVSYLTFMDKYILSCMIFQFSMAAVHNSVAGLISNKDSLKYFEWVCFGAGLFVFVAINVVFGIISVVYMVQTRTLMRDDKEMYKRTNPGNYSRPMTKVIKNEEEESKEVREKGFSKK